MSLACKSIHSPVGKLNLIASDQGLVGVLWQTSDPAQVTLAQPEHNPQHPILLQTEHQLWEYFEGTRTAFTVPLDMRGTAFQQQVWLALLEIPFGETSSYGELATTLGDPKLTRAVGAANGRNPLSIIVPCHRVIGANGKLTGFAGGLSAKAHLLAHEQQHKPFALRA